MRAAVRGSLYSLLLLPEIHRLITCGLSKKEHPITGQSYHNLIQEIQATLSNFFWKS